MDRREAMMLPGSAPYYMQRGMSGSGSGTGNAPGFQGSPSISPSLAAGNIAFQSSSSGAPIPQTLVMDPSSTMSPRGSIGASSSLSQGEPVRRKRGRPRKYGAQGAMSLALNPPPSTQAMSLNPTQKRGRGRPPGSGRKQQPASFGGWLSNTAGIGFAPHVIMIAVGEDITTKIMSFSQQGPRSICILSANGVVSTVTLRQPSTSGGTVTYEGRFEILCLSGSFLVNDSGGSRGSLSVSLASPDGRVIGGGVGGVLIAASPIQQSEPFSGLHCPGGGFMPLILPLGWQAYNLASKLQLRVAKTSKTRRDVPMIEFFMVLVLVILCSKRWLCGDWMIKLIYIVLRLVKMPIFCSRHEKFLFN
ncbi:AT-hook motif nuclear-localized protein 9-like [Capsicum galapagoense]